MTTASAAESLRAQIAPGGLRQDLAAVKVVWERELIAFWRGRTRLVVALMQPLLFLFVLGTGLSSLASAAASDINFRTFMFPGVLAMAVLMPSLFAAGSIVFDRELGFMREMLVGPIHRGAIVIGKCLGGATVAGLQGAVLLCMAGAVDLPYDPVMLATLLAELVLLSFTLVAVGVMAAARITQFQSFQALIQLAMFPMIFLSGAIFPLGGLPDWLAVLTRLDPVTYVVDPMRRAVFSVLDVSPATRAALDPGVSWWGWRVPVGLELAIAVAMGLLALGLAIARFRRIE